jgi:rhomboid family GlyGly-CTERM serine protease
MRNYWLYLGLFSLVLLLAVVEPVSSNYLMFDRQLINSGEIWRLFSAHFVHLSNAHMLGNLLAVCLLGYIAGEYLNNVRGVLLLLWCVLVVGLGLYFFADHLQRYVGLSGVLHGLLLVAPFVSKFYSSRVALCFLFVIVLKVVWEQSGFYDDMAMAETIGGRVEARAHLFGMLAGLAYLLILTLKAKLQTKKDAEKGMIE